LNFTTINNTVLQWEENFDTRTADIFQVLRYEYSTYVRNVLSL
jgi:hypothetical protein